MLRNGHETRGIQGYKREHSTTTIMTTHGMDYATKNRVSMHQNTPQNPLIWQSKDLNKKAYTKDSNMEHRTTTLQGIERVIKCKHVSIKHGLKWHGK